MITAESASTENTEQVHMHYGTVSEIFIEQQTGLAIQPLPPNEDNPERNFTQDPVTELFVVTLMCLLAPTITVSKTMV